MGITLCCFVAFFIGQGGRSKALFDLRGLNRVLRGSFSFVSIGFQDNAGLYGAAGQWNTKV